MSNQNVVEVYRAETGMQAHMFVRALEAAGIRAQIQGNILHPAAESTAPPGGAAPWWDAPRILVFADDAERAKRILLDLEERARKKIAEIETGPVMEVVCEECGQMNTFPVALRGTVQDCQHCTAYVDVESKNG